MPCTYTSTGFGTARKVSLVLADGAHVAAYNPSTYIAVGCGNWLGDAQYVCAAPCARRVRVGVANVLEIALGYPVRELLRKCEPDGICLRDIDPGLLCQLVAGGPCPRVHELSTRVLCNASLTSSADVFALSARFSLPVALPRQVRQTARGHDAPPLTTMSAHFVSALFHSSPSPTPGAMLAPVPWPRFGGGAAQTWSTLSAAPAVGSTLVQRWRVSSLGGSVGALTMGDGGVLYALAGSNTVAVNSTTGAVLWSAAASALLSSTAAAITTRCVRLSASGTPLCRFLSPALSHSQRPCPGRLH